MGMTLVTNAYAAGAAAALEKFASSELIKEALSPALRARAVTEASRRAGLYKQMLGEHAFDMDAQQRSMLSQRLARKEMQPSVFAGADKPRAIRNKNTYALAREIYAKNAPGVPMIPGRGEATAAMEDAARAQYGAAAVHAPGNTAVTAGRPRRPVEGTGSGVFAPMPQRTSVSNVFTSLPQARVEPLHSPDLASAHTYPSVFAPMRTQPGGNAARPSAATQIFGP
jgi:hypothetical protein